MCTPARHTAACDALVMQRCCPAAYSSHLPPNAGCSPYFERRQELLQIDWRRSTYIDVWATGAARVTSTHLECLIQICRAPIFRQIHLVHSLASHRDPSVRRRSNWRHRCRRALGDFFMRFRRHPTHPPSISLEKGTILSSVIIRWVGWRLGVVGLSIKSLG